MRKQIAITCDELRVLYVERGMSMAALARYLGCSIPTVGRRLRACGIATRSGRFQAREIAREELTRLYLEERLPLRVIAERLGVSVGTINNRRRAYGLPARRESRSMRRTDEGLADEGRGETG